MAYKIDPVPPIPKQLIQALDQPVRRVMANAEIYEGTTLIGTCYGNDYLKEFTIERVGSDSKFFGFGICQKLNLKLIDISRRINLTTDNSVKIPMGVKGANGVFYNFPIFHISQTRRDENTNELSVFAYDKLYPANNKQVKDLVVADSYTLYDYAIAAASLLGLTVSIQRLDQSETCFTKIYRKKANLEEDTNLREVFDDIAEATQTIYFVDEQDRLVFKRLTTQTVDLILSKGNYFTLKSGDNKRLQTITHITDLEDNITTDNPDGTPNDAVTPEEEKPTTREDSVSATATGSTQFISNNAWWSLSDDIGPLLDNAIKAVGGLTIAPFEAEWRGNFCGKIGDCLEIHTKDNQIVHSFILDDKIEFNGGLKEITKWSYSQDDHDGFANSTSLGDALKRTYARVDKANKQIDLVAGDVTRLQLTVDGIDITNKVSFSDLEGKGTTVINGSNITTGVIDGERVNLSGCITFGDLNEQLQTEIENAGQNNVPQYIQDTYIDATTIKSPTIQGGTLTSREYDGTGRGVEIGNNKINFYDDYSEMGYIEYYDNDGQESSSHATGGIRIRTATGSGPRAIKIEASGSVALAGNNIWFYTDDYPNGVSLNQLMSNKAVFG